MNFKGEKANNFNGLKALLPSRYIDTGGNIDLVRKYIVYSDLDKKTVQVSSGSLYLCDEFRVISYRISPWKSWSYKKNECGIKLHKTVFNNGSYFLLKITTMDVV